MDAHQSAAAGTRPHRHRWQRVRARDMQARPLNPQVALLT